ncbi:MAG TPA: alpha-hydroxy-acid oxidizing protein [Saprospiraceae bacterium]|nr:alpha-hydroxy-acid oxidizing protein [Saprospiraceae bacterium]
MSLLSALQRQKEIYTAGFSGRRPLVPTDAATLAQKAEEYCSKKAYAYIAGGAGAQDTIDNNRQGLRRWSIVPQMLRDVSERDLSITLLGRKLPSPLLAAPIGVLDLVHPEGDLAVARACSRLGVPMIYSNQASFAMEDCAAEMGESPRWFQLYWSKSDALVQSFLRRAEQCGCEAIVVTLDTTMLGWRPRDLNLGYLPFSYASGIGQYVSDPIFVELVGDPKTAAQVETEGGFSFTKLFNFIRLVRNYKGGGSFTQKFRSKLPVTAVRKFTDIYSRPSISWQDLGWLRKQTQLPILLKGILQAGDAQKALDHGVNGIIVSNHGGRQIGGAIAAIDALPDIVQVINGQIPVLMDSGIRDGADVFKALALGAEAVCLGRPYVYGLAIDGQLGVEAVFRNIIAEFELTMGLSGCSRVADISHDLLKRTQYYG